MAVNPTKILIIHKCTPDNSSPWGGWELCHQFANCMIISNYKQTHYVLARVGCKLGGFCDGAWGSEIDYVARGGFWCIIIVIITASVNTCSLSEHYTISLGYFGFLGQLLHAIHLDFLGVEIIEHICLPFMYKLRYWRLLLPHWALFHRTPIVLSLSKC